MFKIKYKLNQEEFKMEIQTRTMKNDVILDIHGAIDLYNSAILRDIIMTNLKRKEKELNITLNLANVNYIDSSGIGVLITCFHNIKQQNGLFRVVNPVGSVKRIFEITRLCHYFD